MRKTRINIQNRGSVLVLASIFLFSFLLYLIGFPIWIIAVFATGMSFALLLLELIKAIGHNFEMEVEEIKETVSDEL